MSIAECYYNFQLLCKDDDDLYLLGRDEFLHVCIGALDLGQDVTLVGFEDYSSVLVYKDNAWISNNPEETSHAIMSMLAEYPHLAPAVLNLRAKIEAV